MARKTGKHAQISFRLNRERDAELLARLAPFAEFYKQSDVIRLALYSLFGLEPPPELRDMLPPNSAPTQLEWPELAQPDTSDTSASEQFDQILRELAELKETVAAQTVVPVLASDPRQGVHSTALDPGVDSGRAPTPIPSSGLDMSPQRRRQTGRPPVVPGRPALVIDEPPFDPQDSTRRLVDSIMNFGREH
jgi:hypothetical protein